jgi:hypothetical protein
VDQVVVLPMGIPLVLLAIQMLAHKMVVLVLVLVVVVVELAAIMLALKMVVMVIQTPF